MPYTWPKYHPFAPPITRGEKLFFKIRCHYLYDDYVISEGRFRGMRVIDAQVRSKKPDYVDWLLSIAIYIQDQDRAMGRQCLDNFLADQSYTIAFVRAYLSNEPIFSLKRFTKPRVGESPCFGV